MIIFRIDHIDPMVERETAQVVVNVLGGTQTQSGVYPVWRCFVQQLEEQEVVVNQLKEELNDVDSKKDTDA